MEIKNEHVMDKLAQEDNLRIVEKYESPTLGQVKREHEFKRG